jgi:hypothetical protein
MVRIHPDPPGSACDAASGKARGCSSVGRAPALQAGGRRFDPVQLHQRAPGTMATIHEWRQRDQAAATLGGVAVWFFNRNRLLFNNWEEANKRSTQSWSGAGLDCIDWPPSLSSGGAGIANARALPRRLSAREGEWAVLWGQATKCMWWMPWRSQAMKDVAACEKLRGAGKRALIRRCPNGETRPARVTPD